MDYYANSVGYAFKQCYSSGIAITKELTTDDEQLQELKNLATEYNMALEIVDEPAQLYNGIDDMLIAKVLAATNLQDCYK
jgi:phosphoribosylamine-glycine ligase